MFQIMSADEARELPGDLVDVQLHTHRHRTPLDERAFRRLKALYIAPARFATRSRFFKARLLPPRSTHIYRMVEGEFVVVVNPWRLSH